MQHGWGCMFRGPGHDRLVSRRWLEFGPWRVIRRPNDTTFIQFHDLTITDPAEAYAQAAPGHQRMGIDQIGGFIQGIDPNIIAEVKGVFRAKERTLDIVVPPDTIVSQQDMRVACGLRLHHRLTRPDVDRIDTIAYVFIEKADAQPTSTSCGRASSSAGTSTKRASTGWMPTTIPRPTRPHG